MSAPDFYADRGHDDLGEILCAVDDHAQPSAVFRLVALDIIRAGSGQRHERHDEAAHMLANETSTFLPAADEHAN